MDQQWVRQFIITNLIFGIWDYDHPKQQEYELWSKKQSFFHAELLLSKEKKKELLKLMDENQNPQCQSKIILNKHQFMNEQINQVQLANIKYLIIQNMDLETHEIAKILNRLNLRESKLTYLGLSGNKIRDIQKSEQFISFLPNEIEALNLRNNNLNNQDIRQLLCHGKRISRVIDIRQNKSLTKSCSKNFPILYHQSNKKIAILHDLIWQKHVRCCKKLINFLERTSIKFKYCPLVKSEIQENKRLYKHTMILMWISFIIFYAYCLIFPYLYQTNENDEKQGKKTTCSHGFDFQIHIIFGLYLTFLTFYQLAFIYKIRRLVKRKIKIFGLRNILVFSKLFSGVLSRLDLYTDVLFVLIFRSCTSQLDQNGDYIYINPQLLENRNGFSSINFIYYLSLVTLGASLLFPICIFIYVVIDPCRRRRHFYLPHIERMARLSNVSQFKGLSAVLGSYCPDLKVPFKCCDKSVPRYHAVSKLILEDIIQTFCQIIFLAQVKKKNGAEAVISISLTIGSLLLSFAQICLARGAKPSEKIRRKYPPVILNAVSLYFDQNCQQSQEIQISDLRKRQRKVSIIMIAR